HRLKSLPEASAAAPRRPDSVLSPETSMPVHEIRHPLIRHKLGLMRRADLSTKSFRELAQEVAALLTYEASKDMPLEPHSIQGWSGPVQVEKLAGKKVTVVPILRAGIGML